MRVAVLFAFAILVACSKVPERAAAARPSETTFDGALVSDASARAAHGARLSRILGCRGCHGEKLTGKNFLGESSQLGVLYASNLTQVLPRYSDVQLDQLLRRGIHPTRNNLWVMPSQIFQNLSRSDERALIDYLRTLSPAGKPSPAPELSALARKAIASRQFWPAAHDVEEFKRRQPVDLGPQYALGRYITSVTCEECHGSDLSGGEAEGNTPDLIVVGQYTRPEFERLITTGDPLGRPFVREPMLSVAKHRFSHLTPHEREALYNYLKARADQVQ
jgi:cytochrome c5